MKVMYLFTFLYDKLGTHHEDIVRVLSLALYTVRRGGN